MSRTWEDLHWSCGYCLMLWHFIKPMNVSGKLHPFNGNWFCPTKSIQVHVKIVVGRLSYLIWRTFNHLRLSFSSLNWKCLRIMRKKIFTLRRLIAHFSWFLEATKTPRICASSDLESGCPESTFCSEVRANTNEGQCKCSNTTLSFNPKYTNDDDYCVYVKSTNANETASNETNKLDAIGPNAASSSSQEPSDGSGKSIARPLPGTHHIIAGILIPIFFVFVVIGTVFVYKKLHITHRVRNIRRTRRNRPFYEDVMLGNNDNDDPPLI